MLYTPKLLLKLPENHEHVLVEDLNENFVKIDTEIAKISDPETGVEAKLTQEIDKKLTPLNEVVTQHLDDKTKHNQFIHDGTLHQIGFGYNPSLGCMTFSIREVI